MKFVFKIENNNNKGSRLIDIALYEVNVLRFRTRFFKRQIKTTILLLSKSKSKLSFTSIKGLLLIKVFAEQLSIIHILSKQEIKRVEDDLAIY